MTSSASDLYNLLQWTGGYGLHDLGLIALGIIIGTIIAGIALWKA